MDDQDRAVLQGLVAVAWADGTVTSAESELIEGLIAAYALRPSDAAELRLFARSPRTLADVPLTDLGVDARHRLYMQSVLLAWADGDFSAAEQEVLKQLAERLHLDADTVRELARAGEAQAQAQLALLKS